MLGLTIHSKTDTNKLQFEIPDELKGIKLQIIIIPVANSKDEQIEFFTEAELKEMHSINSGTILKDTEDYSKW
jgi:hypothetical protein